MYLNFVKTGLLDSEILLSTKRKLALIIIIGTIFQVSMIFFSGLEVNGNLVFWGVHYHDTLWHTSVVNKLANFSFENPIYSGHLLTNYHYISNFLIALIYRLFRIPLFTLIFRVYPVVVSILLGLLTFCFANRLFRSSGAALWVTFFVYFGSSFSFVFPFFGLGTQYWEGTLWVQQSVSNFSNIPLVTSFVILLAAFSVLINYLKDKKKQDLYLSAFLFGILPGTKAFSAVFIGVLMLVGLYRLFKFQERELLEIGTLSLLVAVVIMLPVITAQQQFIFEPGYFLKSVMEAKDRLNWQDWALRYQVYEEHSNLFGFFRLWSYALLIFMFGNIGTRIVAVFGIKNFVRYLEDATHQILFISSLVFLVLPMLFLSTGIAWNTIQFYYYFLFILNFYAGFGFYKLLKLLRRKSLRTVAVFFLVLFTLPVGFKTIYDQYNSRPNLVVTESELSTLKLIGNENTHPGVILTLPPSGNFTYVAAISGKSLYLGDELMATVTGMNYQQRLDGINESLKSNSDFSQLVEENAISHVYSKSDAYGKLLENEGILELMYKDKMLSVYKVKQGSL